MLSHNYKTPTEPVTDALLRVMSDQMEKLEMLKKSGENLEEALECLFPMYLAVSKNDQGIRLSYVAAPFSMISPENHLSLLMQAKEPIDKDMARSGANFIGWVSIVTAGQFDKREVDVDKIGQEDITIDNTALLATICTPNGEEACFASDLKKQNYGFVDQDRNQNNITTLVVWALANDTYVNIGDVMQGMGGAKC